MLHRSLPPPSEWPRGTMEQNADGHDSSVNRRKTKQLGHVHWTHVVCVSINATRINRQHTILPDARERSKHPDGKPSLRSQPRTPTNRLGSRSHTKDDGSLEVAAEKNKKMQLQYKEYYDRKAADRDFSIGDLVLMKNRDKLNGKRIGNKFHPEFDRLYRVMAIDNNSRLKLKRVGAPLKRPEWHNSALFKHFMGSEEAYLEYEGRLRIAKSGIRTVNQDDALCRICGGTFLEDMEKPDKIIWLECDGCTDWYHLHCVGRDPEDTAWECPDCDNRGR